MPRRIFIDIETLPPGEEFRVRLAQEFAQELANEDGYVNQQELGRLVELKFRDLALRPEYGRLLAIGLIIEEDNQIVHHGILGRSRVTNKFHLDEGQILQSFWKLIRGFDIHQDLLIGHNILDFDLQFICKRSMINQVRPSVDICFTRYRSQPVFDTMWEWGHWNWKHVAKLSELAESFGLRSSKLQGIDGGSVYDHFCAGRHDEIAFYCMRDVESVREIYYRMNFLAVPPLTSYETKFSPLLSLMKAYR